jgi:uncharacterized protein (TIGR00369 family)
MRPANPTYGVVNPKDIIGLTGKDILQRISDGRLPAPTMAQTLGMWLAEVGDGFVVFEGDTAAEFQQPFGLIHGGWALTLIDSATTCAAQTLLPADVGCTTIETKGNFSRPITPKTGCVRAEGRVVGRGRRIISAEAKLFDSAGRIVAHGTSTIMVLGGEASGGATAKTAASSAVSPADKT